MQHFKDTCFVLQRVPEQATGPPHPTAASAPTANARLAPAPHLAWQAEAAPTMRHSSTLYFRVPEEQNIPAEQRPLRACCRTSAGLHVPTFKILDLTERGKTSLTCNVLHQSDRCPACPAIRYWCKLASAQIQHTRPECPARPIILCQQTD